MESVKQEKKDLGKMPGDIKQMSSGSWMSKHISSPLAMGKAHSMAPKMENGSAAYMDGPLEGNAFGGKMAANQASGMSKEEAAKKAAQDLKK